MHAASKGPSLKLVPALPSLEFLLDSKDPKAILQKIMLACLDQEAQHIKRAKYEMEEAHKYRTMADSANWLIEAFPGMVDTVRRMIELQSVIPFPEKQEEPEPIKRPRWAGAPSTANKRA